MYIVNRNKSEVFEVLNNYLIKLDNAPISPDGMFTSERDKERYEKTFIYAFRKYQAAIYHYKNVQRFIEAEKADMKTSMIPDVTTGANTKFRPSKLAISISRTADHYVYELSAFLGVLRSSIDFLCTACAPHLSGIKMDSVTTLIKLVEKRGKSGPIIDVVRNNIEWLKELRSYRDHFVHRQIISSLSGYEKHSIGDITKTVRYPVVIPKSLPFYAPDTRRERMMDDELSRLDFSMGEARIITEDGNEEIVYLFIEYDPSSDFIAIEDFMKLHLSSYEEFFAQVIQSLEKLEFKTYKPD